MPHCVRIKLPSGVGALRLAFDVRALSWDIWGGDHLQIDLVDGKPNGTVR